MAQVATLLLPPLLLAINTPHDAARLSRMTAHASMPC